ncbi:MAG: tyrosine-protein phosphatase [Sarcina sp.]
MKEFKNLKAIRNTDKTISISFDSDSTIKNISVYVLESPCINSKKTLITTSDSNPIIINDPDKNKRNYFLVESDDFKSQIIAERVLPLEGACNFRDLGGMKASDGKTVKWDKFYRSDSLATLTEQDINYLENIDFKIILDYRSQQEASYEKDKTIPHSKYINISAMPMDAKFNGNLDMNYLLKNGAALFQNKENPTDFLTKGYEDMAFNNPAFKQLISIMKEDDTRPFVQHCKSGKDRTGIGSALVLLLLGVPMETVKQDYLASNIYRKNYNDSIIKKYKKYLDTDEKVALFNMVMDVKEEYFDATFKTIFSKYKTLDEYFEKEYNLTTQDITNLRDKYLY